MPILMQDQTELQPLNYSDVYSAFSAAARDLGSIYSSVDLEKYQPRFKNYQKYLRKTQQRCNAEILLKSISGNGVPISTVDPHEILIDKIVCAKLTAYSVIFNDWKLFFSREIEAITNSYLDYNLSPLKNAPVRTLSREIMKLHAGDSVWFIHLLKQIGLLPATQKDIQLLSFGTASGSRELDATQIVPKIELKNEGDQLLARFSHKVTQPSHSIFVDNDPYWKETYEKINLSKNDKLLAVHMDLYNALDEMPHTLLNEKLNKRNFVNIWRLEHAAIPNVVDFFSKLKNSISDNAHFIVTIGAGNTDIEFKCRQEKLQEMSDYLDDRKLKPVIITAHHGNRLEPYFGSFDYASHEILYCSLNPEKLST